MLALGGLRTDPMKNGFHKSPITNDLGPVGPPLSPKKVLPMCRTRLLPMSPVRTEKGGGDFADVTIQPQA